MPADAGFFETLSSHSRLDHFWDFSVPEWDMARFGKHLSLAGKPLHLGFEISRNLPILISLAVT